MNFRKAFLKWNQTLVWKQPFALHLLSLITELLFQNHNEWCRIRISWMLEALFDMKCKLAVFHLILSLKKVKLSENLMPHWISNKAKKRNWIEISCIWSSRISYLIAAIQFLLILLSVFISIIHKKRIGLPHCLSFRIVKNIVGDSIVIQTGLNVFSVEVFNPEY